MAISLHTAGSWVAATATTQTVALPTHSTGDMLIVRVGFKHATMPTTVTVDTAGWAKLGETNGTGGASSNGGGGVQVAVFWKVATSASETDPVVTFNGGSVAATPSAAVANAYSKGAGETWVTPVGAGAAVAAATSISATIASHVSTTAGDLVDEFHVTNDNTTLTVPTFTQTGVTFAAVVESPAAALSSATSNDIAADGCYRIATAGTSSAAAVVTGTNSVADVGAAWTTRLRVFTPETHSGTLTGTGGGVVSPVGRKGARVAATATGGGVATAVGRKGARSLLTNTGGGISTVAPTTDREAVIVGTGGGVATFVGVAEFGEEHSGVLAATGAGVAALIATTARSGSVEATASGAATLASVAARRSAITATASGAATLSVEAARFGAMLLSGGGVLTTASVTARLGVLMATGGGEATFQSGSQPEEHDGTLAATASGGWTTTPETTRLAALIASGGGSVTFASATARDGVLAATGGGRVTVNTGGPVGPLPDIVIDTGPTLGLVIQQLPTLRVEVD